MAMLATIGLATTRAHSSGVKLALPAISALPCPWAQWPSQNLVPDRRQDERIDQARRWIFCLVRNTMS
jgi:hypothetical protein